MSGIGSEDGDGWRPDGLRAKFLASQSARVGRACDARDMRAIVSRDRGSRFGNYDLER